MKKTILGIAAVAAGLATTPAIAQDWHGYNNDWRGGGYQNWRGNDGWRGDFARICTGDRAHQLEAQIRQEQREGDIDGGTARYLHRMVDQVESQQKRACRFGDGYQINDIARRSDWIGQQLHREVADGRRWDRRWRY